MNRTSEPPSAATQEVGEALRAERTVVEQAQAVLRQQQAELDAARERWREEREESDRFVEARQAELERFANRTEEDRSELNGLRDALAAERAAIEAERAQCRQLADDLATQREEMDRRTVTADEESTDLLQRQRQQLVRERKELESLQKSLESERDSVQSDRARCQRLAEDLSAQRADLDRQLQSLAQESARLKAEKDSFDEEQQTWEAAQDHARRQIEQRAEQLDRQKELLEEQRQSLAAEQQAWEALQAEAEGKLAARAEQLDAREQEIDERTAELERCASPARAVFEPAGPAELEFLDDSQEPEPAKSMNSLELFRQMTPAASNRTIPLSELSALRNSLLEEEPEAETSEPEPEPDYAAENRREGGCRSVSQILLEDPVIADSFLPRTPEASPPPAHRKAKATVEDDREESIEQYMAGLLARVNSGGSYTPGSQAPPDERPVPVPIRESRMAPEMSEPDEESGQSAEEAEEAMVAASEEPDQVAPSIRRARAPERIEDLAMFREVANMSAQSALDTHARSRLLKSVNAKLSVVAIALTTAGVLFYRWMSVPDNEVFYYAGLGVVLIAVFWSVQYAALAGYACLTGKRKRVDDQAAELADIADPEDLGERENADTPPGEATTHELDCRSLTIEALAADDALPVSTDSAAADGSPQVERR
ncbi:MAG: hypothetical protein ACYC6Y_05965 [Thermoguttaceae bacterium]